MNGYIDIKRLTIDELVGVVNLYPWYGGARKELCLRMSRAGDAAWGTEQYADAAMFLPSRAILSDMLRSSESPDMGDSDVDTLIKSYIAADEIKTEPVRDKPSRKVYAGVGDYFSQEQYDSVRQEDDRIFSRYAAKARQNATESVQELPEFDFFTETLAQIYAEQGYYEQAKDIYSKLILAYPEKNAYFAALIQKIDELN